MLWIDAFWYGTVISYIDVDVDADPKKSFDVLIALSITGISDVYGINLKIFCEIAANTPHY